MWCICVPCYKCCCLLTQEDGKAHLKKGLERLVKSGCLVKVPEQMQAFHEELNNLALAHSRHGKGLGQGCSTAGSP